MTTAVVPSKSLIGIPAGVANGVIATPIASVCQLKNWKAPTGARIVPNIQGRPYEFFEQHWGTFVVPPDGAFVVGAGVVGPDKPLATWGSTVASAGGVILKTSIPTIGEAVLTVLHPYVQKGCCILMLPNSESSPAAFNAFNASYYAAWSQSVSCLGFLDTTINSTLTLLGNSAAFTGAIMVAQVDNGSFTLQMAAQYAWPCYGMRVHFCIFNPPNGYYDCGVGLNAAGLEVVAATSALHAGPSLLRV